MALPYVRPTIKKNPYRSKKGCLTCKKRKKKCDETQPQCRRCIDGGFDCLGYSYPSTSAGSIVREESTSLGTLDVAALFGHPGRSDPVSSLGFWMGNASSRIEQVGSGAGQPNSVQIQRRTRPSVPQGIRFDPFEVDNMISFVVLQVSQLPSCASFRPFPFSIEHAIARHLKTSPYTRWSMYIGARIGLAMSEGTSWYPYIGWVDDFRARMLNLSIDSNTGSTELDTRLGSIQGLTSWSFATLGSLAGYMLHKQNLPLFLQLATRLPEVWTNSYEISISRVFHDPDQSISQFIFTDTVTVVAFGLPPLVRYDTTIGPEDWLPPPRWSALDRVTGWPVAILILFAKINSLGVARESNQSRLSGRERVDIEQGLRDWKPVIDHDVNSSICITQLVIQECWRHTLLIYMYMAACDLNSADPQVEYLVQQVFLLARTIEGDRMSEEYLFIPCLIAGAAARKEKHRKLFYRRMPTCRRLSHFLLQGFDFVPVLDHLWHGAAAGGRAVTWGDYVNSRSSIIPINV